MPPVPAPFSGVQAYAANASYGARGVKLCREIHESKDLAASTVERLMRWVPICLFVLTLAPAAQTAPTKPFRVVHVHVALCDNEHQGIVPVGKVLGDGKDPEHNLYWGAGYGVKTFFARSAEWTELAVGTPPKAPVLRRAAFLSKKLSPPVLVIADAYDGERIDVALADFLGAAAGKRKLSVVVTGKEITYTAEGGSAADLVAWVGHDALMDFAVKSPPKLTPGDAHPEGAIVLACMSQKYFSPPLRAAGTEALLMTTNFMAPEAYTLDAAIRSWGASESPAQVRVAAGKAYAQYQKISDGSGIGLFATGYAK